ncbi:MAG: VWA domain-containing protein [Armatimonadetes bacterium]|nr:VWA domain-containing protein [Armatimonadota bacterium]
MRAVVAVDHSGSTIGGKTQARLLNTASSTIDRLESQGYDVAAIGYSDSVDVVQDFGRVNKQAFLKEVCNAEAAATGDTGALRLAEAMIGDEPGIVAFVTDGIGETDFAAAVRQAEGRNHHVVGYMVGSSNETEAFTESYIIR